MRHDARHPSGSGGNNDDGGAGGAAYLAAPRISLGANGRISAIGGAAGAAGRGNGGRGNGGRGNGGRGNGGRGNGGQGSVGRIRIDAGDLQNGGAVLAAPTQGAFDCALPE